MKKNAELESSIREVLDSQGVAVLSTRGEKFPHACLVAFVFSPDLDQIIFATSRSSRKYNNIKQDHRASILVDTRTNAEEDFHKASVVSAYGFIDELSGSDARKLEKQFLERHPYLEEFLAAPTTALMGMKVASYSLVSRFQNVLLLEMDRGPDT
jgi:nitroimidazol reductase NimA-like FMN-containing flavoprotein (pyridoxamine 5'-phosphate oxidase superfamily)